MRFLDLILAKTMADQVKPGTDQTEPIAHPTQYDRFQRLSAYRGWPLFLRLALSLRYTRIKAELLARCHEEGVSTLKDVEIRKRLHRVLTAAGAARPAAPVGRRSTG